MELCNKFREYLLNARQLKRDGYITRNSASGYWSTFRRFLKILYRNRLIKSNINDFLEKIEPEDVVKDYLSVEELYCLAETPCKIPVLKTASLFSCLTSLRLSDILTLCWEEIVDFAAGGKCVHTITQKTKTEDIISISDEALKLIEYSAYQRVFGKAKAFTHKIVVHGKGNYVNGDVHTNNIEGFWNITKDAVCGTYNHVSRKYLQRYCDEVSFRFNSRKVSKGESFCDLFANCKGTRITYKQLVTS